MGLERAAAVALGVVLAGFLAPPIANATSLGLPGDDPAEPTPAVSEDPRARSLAVARAAISAQADVLGTPLAPSVPAPRHASPSEAVAALLARHGAATPTQATEAASLDTLAPPVRAALTRVIDSFMVIEDATATAFAGVDADQIDHASDLDLAPVLSARLVLFDAAAALEEAVAAAGGTPAASTSAGAATTASTSTCGEPANSYPTADTTPATPKVLAIDVVGADNCYTNDFRLVIDLGGKDAFHNNAGGSTQKTLFSGVAGALVDLGGGDDSYSTTDLRNWGVNGGGYLGSGFLYDDGGNDVYTAGSVGTNGGATSGTGFLYDGSGNDTYSAHNQGTNGGGNGGLGLLVDGAGNDTYTAAGSHGTNGGAASGVGALVDLDRGVDSYTVGVDAAGNGGGYFGAGLLFDAAGEGDKYTHGPVDGRTTEYDKSVIPKGTAGAQVDQCRSGMVAPTDPPDVQLAAVCAAVVDGGVARGLSVNDVLVAEGNAGTVSATFTVTLSAPATRTISVDYATSDGSATAGADYTATSGTLSFAAGETTKTVSVPVMGDTLIEPDETFFLNLSAPVGATLADAQGVATIVNDDFGQGLFRPVSSARIFGPVNLGETATANVQVTGAGGVPTSGVSGVALSITVTNPSTASFMTVWPTGATRPTVSSLNWTAGETVANAVQVKLGTGGKVSLYNQWGTAPVTVDVVGWYTDETATSGGGRYNAVVPSRILDSRDGTGGVPVAPLVASPTCASPTAVKLTGADTALGEVVASAVVVNLTVTPSSGQHTTGSGALVAWPAGEAVPVGSNVPYDLSRPSRRTVPTLAVTKVGTGGYVNVCNRAPAGSAAMHAIADVQGWYSPETTPSGPGARLVPITPERFLDTRNPLFLNVTGRSSPDKLTAPEILDLQVTGRGEVPAEGVAAVVMNVTATEPDADSFMVVWPTGTPIPVQSHAVPGQQVPEASTLNFVAGQNVPNLVIVPVGLDGKVSFYNAHGGTHVIADVVGWFTN